MASQSDTGIVLHKGFVFILFYYEFYSQAPVKPVDSVRGMLKVITSLAEKDSGTLLDWEGNSIPWWYWNNSTRRFQHTSWKKVEVETVHQKVPIILLIILIIK